MEEKSRVMKDKLLKIFIITFGIVIVLDYPLFNLIASYVFRIIVCGFILYEAREFSWYWCDKWFRTFLEMIRA